MHRIARVAMSSAPLHDARARGRMSDAKRALVARARGAFDAVAGRRRRVNVASGGDERGTTTREDARASDGDDANGYRRPPDALTQFTERPQSPNVTVSPDRRRLLYLHKPPPLPDVATLAREEVKLAGVRIDAAQNSTSRMGHQTKLAIGAMPAREEEIGAAEDFVGTPENALINYVSWSPDGTKIAFTTRSSGEPGEPERGPLTLWIADAHTRQCRVLLPDRGLNTIFESYRWLNDDVIVACCIPENRPKEAPKRPQTPFGPRIQTNRGGNVAQARTYADLLKDSHDADLFDYYCSSELVAVDVSTGATKTWGDGKARIYTRCDPSPDGKYAIVEAIHRPYSYSVPCGRFPKKVWVADSDGKVVREVADLPLAENVPIVHNATRKGPRAVNWRSDKSASLYWTEAQDEGDPRVEVSPRDVTYTVDVGKDPAATPKTLFQTDYRYGGVAWGGDDMSILYESWYKTRTSRVWVTSPGDADPNATKRMLWERDYEDSYNAPGSFATRRTEDGSYILARVVGPTPLGEGKPTGPGVKLLLQGDGANPEGDRPFIDLFDVDTGAKHRMWESKPPYLEHPGSLISDYGGPEAAPVTLETMRILFSRESPSENSQFFSLQMTADGSPGKEVKISNFPHPHPDLKELPKEIIKYKRDDGVELNGTLYTPPGYDAARDGPLPLLMWAYPREFKTKEAASQLRDSPYRFTGIGPSSALVWLARGYAVLDGPALPIIGEGEGVEPNDTYVEQLVAGARAAVNEVVARGVADPERIAVGGHSYGAFMAANLLAHAPDLFACAIARSGAYNRTLTPFGFQAEERTLWEAPETYNAMSPFMNAHKIKKPILLIHGEEDQNSGTHLMQSERFFSALKGNGAEVKLVILPHESHGYRAKESINHMLAETSDWLDAHCAPGAKKAAEARAEEAAKAKRDAEEMVSK
jgi:dipeptidyl aminopeptidase/acylaminoacyl peptidase